MRYELEVIAFDIDSCQMAQVAGANRIELCANPMEGGTTPSLGMIKEARSQVSIQLFPIIRPRGGDFLYNELEFNIMCRDIEACVEAGCDGVVIGLLNKNGTIDSKRVQKLVDIAGTLEVTFHRAFDRVKDPITSLEEIIAIGCKRILTSGLYQQSIDGITQLKSLVQHASDRITIMVGSGVNSTNIHKIATETGARAFHSSARTRYGSKMSYHSETMQEDLSTFTINPEEVRNLKNALDQYFQL
jgi:copper homeostasis protein